MTEFNGNFTTFPNPPSVENTDNPSFVSSIFSKVKSITSATSNAVQHVLPLPNNDPLSTPENHAAILASTQVSSSGRLSSHHPSVNLYMSRSQSLASRRNTKSESPSRAASALALALARSHSRTRSTDRSDLNHKSSLSSSVSQSPYPPSVSKNQPASQASSLSSLQLQKNTHSSNNTHASSNTQIPPHIPESSLPHNTLRPSSDIKSSNDDNYDTNELLLSASTHINTPSPVDKPLHHSQSDAGTLKPSTTSNPLPSQNHPVSGFSLAPPALFLPKTKPNYASLPITQLSADAAVSRNQSDNMYKHIKNSPHTLNVTTKLKKMNGIDVSSTSSVSGSTNDLTGAGSSLYSKDNSSTVDRDNSSDTESINSNAVRRYFNSRVDRRPAPLKNGGLGKEYWMKDEHATECFGCTAKFTSMYPYYYYYFYSHLLFILLIN